MQKLLFAVAAIAMAGAATAFTTAPALANSGSAIEQITIDTSGYDLRSARGHALLANQIERAAQRVCGAIDTRNLTHARTVRGCQRDAVADAMTQLSALTRTSSVTIGASR